MKEVQLLIFREFVNLKQINALHRIDNAHYDALRQFDVDLTKDTKNKRKYSQYNGNTEPDPQLKLSQINVFQLSSHLDRLTAFREVHTAMPS